MLILALDTSTRSGSVALARDGQLLAGLTGDAVRLHVERLPGVLTDLLSAYGASLDEVDRFAVLSGPGGFTGLRVGLATIQGLAFALNREVFVASTLELFALVAHQAEPGCPLAAAWMRGMRGEVFSAIYRVAPCSAPSGLEPVLQPMVGTPVDAAATWPERVGDLHVALSGDAWTSPDGDPLRARVPEGHLRYVDAPPLAGVLALLAGHPAAVPVTAHAVAPTYVRRPDAEITRERAGAILPGAR